MDTLLFYFASKTENVRLVYTNIKDYFHVFTGPIQPMQHENVTSYIIIEQSNAFYELLQCLLQLSSAPFIVFMTYHFLQLIHSKCKELDILLVTYNSFVSMTPKIESMMFPLICIYVSMLSAYCLNGL